MSRPKQPAITKHPKGTASFCIRVRLPSGGRLEIVAERPRTVREIADSLEHNAAVLRRVVRAGDQE